jgi:hypothetical protein
MLEQHRSNSAVVVGSSTHNERIEQLWRDVRRCVIGLFADLFVLMEQNCHLSCENEVDLFCLHSVFLPRINDALNNFIESWNNHPISSEHNMSPNQLFIKGALTQRITPSLPTNVSTYSEVLPVPAMSEHLSLPRCTFSPCDDLIKIIEAFDMLEKDEDFGYTLLLRVCDVVGKHIVNCSVC